MPDYLGTRARDGAQRSGDVRRERRRDIPRRADRAVGDIRSRGARQPAGAGGASPTWCGRGTCGAITWCRRSNRTPGTTPSPTGSAAPTFAWSPRTSTTCTSARAVSASHTCTAACSTFVARGAATPYDGEVPDMPEPVGAVDPPRVRRVWRHDPARRGVVRRGPARRAVAARPSKRWPLPTWSSWSARPESSIPRRDCRRRRSRRASRCRGQPRTAHRCRTARPSTVRDTAARALPGLLDRLDELVG